MKAKFKVVELKKLEKGYVLSFQTPYGETLGCFYNKDVKESDILENYPIGMVDVFDVQPYHTKNGLGLGVSAPLGTTSTDELF